jgi:hypothetical protein
MFFFCFSVFFISPIISKVCLDSLLQPSSSQLLPPAAAVPKSLLNPIWAFSFKYSNYSPRTSKLFISSINLTYILDLSLPLSFNSFKNSYPTLLIHSSNCFWWRVCTRSLICSLRINVTVKTLVPPSFPKDFKALLEICSKSNLRLRRDYGYH